MDQIYLVLKFSEKTLSAKFLTNEVPSASVSKDNAPVRPCTLNKEVVTSMTLIKSLTLRDVKGMVL